MKIESQNDLLGFLITQAGSGQKNWFGFAEQRLTGIHLAHEIAANHANTMTPIEVVEYVVNLNNSIYKHLIKAD
jgi:hypothetical protein